MDNSLISPYAQALSTRKAQLESYLDQGFQAIAIPAHTGQFAPAGMHFLGKSGVTFFVIGVIALVAGLIVGSMGLIIAGAAAIVSGCYLWAKGKQATRTEAFALLGKKIFAEISVIADKIASDWHSFVAVQNDNLKKQIVSSSASVDSKVALIDKVEKSTEVNVDLDAMQADIQAVDAREDLDGYTAYLARAEQQIKTAIENADGAQKSIYTTINV